MCCCCCWRFPLLKLVISPALNIYPSSQPVSELANQPVSQDPKHWADICSNEEVRNLHAYVYVCTVGELCKVLIWKHTHTQELGLGKCEFCNQIKCRVACKLLCKLVRVYICRSPMPRIITWDSLTDSLTHWLRVVGCAFAFHQHMLHQSKVHGLRFYVGKLFVYYSRIVFVMHPPSTSSLLAAVLQSSVCDCVVRDGS